MQILLILALVVAVLAVIFAVQNTATVTLAFLAWRINGPLALVLLVALAVGALISLLASLPTLIKGRLRVASQKRRLANLEASLSDCTKKLSQAQSQLDAMAAAKQSKDAATAPPSPSA
jgi:putative membrane protein